MGGYYGWSDGWLLWVGADRCLQSDAAPDSTSSGRWDGMVFRRVTFSAVNAIPPTLGPIFWVGGSGPDSACIRGAAASRGVQCSYTMTSASILLTLLCSRPPTPLGLPTVPCRAV